MILITSMKTKIVIVIKRSYINPKYIEHELIFEKDLKDQILLTINENNKNEFIKYQMILNINLVS